MTQRVPMLALAQVDTPHPEEFAVSVVFPHLGIMSAIHAQVAAAGATATAGHFAMPQRGDWGLVMFHQDDYRSARWVMNLTDSSRNAIPKELLSLDPDAVVHYERNGRENYRHGNGDLEVQHPDGSLFTLTHQGPRSPGARTKRYIGVPTEQGKDWKEKRVAYLKHRAKPLELYFLHASGLKATMDKEGVLELTTQGYGFKVEPSGELAFSNSAGAALTITAGGEVRVHGATTVNIDAGATVNLGGEGGRPVARVGDTVSTPSGPGTITSGSSKVMAAG